MTVDAQMYERLGELKTTAGIVGVYRVPNMLPIPAHHTRAYAAVVELLALEFVGDPIAMLVTVHDPRDADENVRDLGVRSWSGKERTVDNVYADREFRGGGTPTNPVAVGQLLFACEAFTHHSAERSDSGDQWAGQVDGSLPARVPVEDPATLDANMRDALDRLRESDWARQFRRSIIDDAQNFERKGS